MQAELQAETPLWLGHVVAGQPHFTLVSEVSMLPPRVGVATCALGNFWLGARVCIPRLLGPRSIYQLADLDQLEAAATSSSGSLPWL